MSSSKPSFRRRDPRGSLAAECVAYETPSPDSPSTPAPRAPAARPPAVAPALARDRLWRYGLSGALATGVYYALLVALVEGLQARPGLAAAFAAAIGALVAYLLNRRYTFVGAAPHRYALPRFLATAALAAGGNGLIVSGAAALWGWHYLAAQALATGAVLFLTFHINRRWAFAHT